jgi:hypothetical protein
MKTNTIRDALGTLGFTHDVSEPMAQLKALEESHAEMARALMAFVDAADNGLPSDLPRLDHGAREALRKAGVL